MRLICLSLYITPNSFIISCFTSLTINCLFLMFSFSCVNCFSVNFVFRPNPSSFQAFNYAWSGGIVFPRFSIAYFTVSPAYISSMNVIFS